VRKGAIEKNSREERFTTHNHLTYESRYWERFLVTTTDTSSVQVYRGGLPGRSNTQNLYLKGSEKR